MDRYLEHIKMLQSNDLPITRISRISNEFKYPKASQRRSLSYRRMRIILTSNCWFGISVIALETISQEITEQK